MTNQHYDNNSESSGWALNRSQQSKAKKKWPIVVGAIAVVTLCCGGGIAAINDSDTSKNGSQDGLHSARPVVTSTVPTTKNSDPTPIKNSYVPTTKDIVLKIKVTKKQCFDTAGCLVDFRIDTLTYTGGAIDDSKGYEVTYEVKGLKDPYTNTLTLNSDGTFEFQKEESSQTATTKVALSAVVTSVSEKL